MTPRSSPPNTVARVGFVSVALEVALTFCRLATDANERQLRIYVAKARKAYDIANRYMFELDKGAREFHALSATAERIKLMLEALQTRTAPPPPPPPQQPTQIM